MIPSDEVLKKAADYANRKCNYVAHESDLTQALWVMKQDEHIGPWADAVREYVERYGTKDDSSISAEPIDFDSYERVAMSMAFYPGRGDGNLSYPMLGLCGEAGEAAEKWKKALRDDGGRLTDDRREALKKELGDVLWYVTACAQEAGFTLREVAEANLAKLTDRSQRGKLGGSGDER